MVVDLARDNFAEWFRTVASARIFRMISIVYVAEKVLHVWVVQL